MKTTFPVFAALVLSAALVRGETWVSGAPDRADPVSYAVGDEVVWTFRAERLPPSAAGRPLVWSWTVGGDGPASTGTAPFVPGAPLVVTNVFAAPGFLRASAALVDAESGRALRAAAGVAAGAAGAGAAIGSLPPPEEPADFDAFWRAAKAEALAPDPSLPPASLLPPPEEAVRAAPGFRVSSFAVPMTRGRPPATGWVAWPANAAEKSLPLVVRFWDYGMGPQKFPADFDRDALFVCVHPHGFLPGRDDAFYSAAFAAISNGGHGGAYGFRDEENASPETCYFRGMVQRALASVRFAKTLPMWDGERLTLAGRGQGAFLAVACAALLDDRPTFCRLSAPWLCGLGLDTSWQPKFQPALRYFDAANFARRVRCPAQIEADLLDTAHAPAGAARLYSALGGPKRLVFRQGESGEPASTLEAGD